MWWNVKMSSWRLDMNKYLQRVSLTLYMEETKFMRRLKSVNTKPTYLCAGKLPRVLWSRPHSDFYPAIEIKSSTWSSSGEDIRTSRMGYLSNIRICNHSSIIGRNCLRAWIQWCRSGKKRYETRKRTDSARNTRGKCCLQYRGYRCAGSSSQRTTDISRWRHTHK